MRFRIVAALIPAAFCASCSSPDAGRLAALESRVSEVEKQPTAAAAASRASFAPGLGEIMGLNQIRHDKLWFAGENANWPLAAYFVRRVRSLQRKLAVVRPKYAGDLAAFEDEHIDPALAACDAADRNAFDRAFAAATDRANEMHVKWAKPYIRWTLPDEPPKDLEMSGQP